MISTNSLILLQSIFHLKLSLLCLKPLSGFSKLRIKSKPGMTLPLTTALASGHPSRTTKLASLGGRSSPWGRSHLRASAPRALCSTESVLRQALAGSPHQGMALLVFHSRHFSVVCLELYNQNHFFLENRPKLK